MTTTELLGTIAMTGAGEARVSFARHYPTTPADLWEAVTTTDRLARWFAPVEGELSPGGTFTIHFDDGDTPACRVVACDAPRAFDWEWDDGERTSAVRVEVAPDADGALLRLVHTRLGSAAAPEYGAGWQSYLHSLADHLGAGPGRVWWADFAEAKAAYAASLAVASGD